MAIFFLRASTVSRATGRSSIDASAYITGTKQYNERTGKTADYRHKGQQVLYNAIMAPKGAPAWMSNRAQLWNHVELSERRRDAQTARTLVGALPHELTLEDDIALARDFAQSLCDDGMVVDMGIHPPDKRHTKEKDPRGEQDTKAEKDSTNKNVHVHFELTTREIVNGGFGKKVRAWNSKEYLAELKQRWEKLCNRYLARAGCKERIDSRSPLEHDLPLLPTLHLGVDAYHMECRGVRTRKGNYNRAIKRYNAALTACYERLGALADARDKAQRELDDMSAKDKRIEQLTAQSDAISKRLKSLDRRRSVLLDALHTGRLAHKPTGVINKLSGKTSRWTHHWRKANKYVGKVDREQAYMSAKSADVGQSLQRLRREQYLDNQPRKDTDALARLALGTDEQQDKSLTANRQLMSEAAKEREQNKQVWRSI